MADRRDLQQELNRINKLFQEKDLEMRKAGASTEQRQMMRDLLNQKKERLISEIGDDLQSLNTGKSINVGNATISPGIDQSKMLDAAAPRKGFSKTLGAFGKKAAGIIPLAGAGIAALSGDPALAAEGLVEDASEFAGPIAAKLGAGAAAGPVGMAAMGLQQTLNPSDSGNVEEERMDIAEDKARKAYKTSPAGQGKLAKLKAMMGVSESDVSPIAKPAPSRKLMTPEMIQALTGVDPNKEAQKQQLEKDLEAGATDPQAARDLKLRKLFQGQLKK